MCRFWLFLAKLSFLTLLQGSLLAGNLLASQMSATEGYGTSSKSPNGDPDSNIVKLLDTADLNFRVWPRGSDLDVDTQNYLPPVELAGIVASYMPSGVIFPALNNHYCPFESFGKDPTCNAIVDRLTEEQQTKLLKLVLEHAVPCKLNYRASMVASLALLELIRVSFLHLWWNNQKNLTGAPLTDDNVSPYGAASKKEDLIWDRVLIKSTRFFGDASFDRARAETEKTPGFFTLPGAVTTDDDKFNVVRGLRHWNKVAGEANRVCSTAAKAHKDQGADAVRRASFQAGRAYVLGYWVKAAADVWTRAYSAALASEDVLHFDDLLAGKNPGNEPLYFEEEEKSILLFSVIEQVLVWAAEGR